jgi:hypothetical protein
MTGDQRETPAAEGLRAIAENSENMAAIGKILHALEDMQQQIGQMLELMAAQDRRIDKIHERVAKLEFGPAPVIDMTGRIKGIPKTKRT